MRMRHKKNLDQRWQVVEDYIITLRTESKNFSDASNEKNIINLSQAFDNENPVLLEVGCGKGRFAVEYAKQHPEINILGVEKVKDVIVMGAEKAHKEGLKNVLFLDASAEYLTTFLPEHSFNTIFLNFSCPYPKNRQETHRLTSKLFLDIYKSLLTSNGVICQKTDNMHFFEYSIESLSQNGFYLSEISLDLHNSDFEGNIVTEYEEKFASQNMPIYRLEARLEPTDND